MQSVSDKDIISLCPPRKSKLNIYLHYILAKTNVSVLILKTNRMEEKEKCLSESDKEKIKAVVRLHAANPRPRNIMLLLHNEHNVSHDQFVRAVNLEMEELCKQQGTSVELLEQTEARKKLDITSFKLHSANRSCCNK